MTDGRFHPVNPGANYGWLVGADHMLAAVVALITDPELEYVTISSPWSGDSHTITRSILDTATEPRQ